MGDIFYYITLLPHATLNYAHPLRSREGYVRFMRMVLSTHAVAGAAVAILARDPWIGFATAIISHFLLDTVPHWHYPLPALKKARETDGRVDARDTRKILAVFATTGSDCLIGFGVAIAAAEVFGADPMLAAVGAAGGVLPDFLQFVYFLFPKTAIRHLQGFHKWIHTDIRLDDRHLLGITSQVMLIAASVWIIGVFA